MNAHLTKISKHRKGGEKNTDSFITLIKTWSNISYIMESLEHKRKQKSQRENWTEGKCIHLSSSQHPPSPHLPGPPDSSHHPQLLATTGLLSVSMDLPVPDDSCKWNQTVCGLWWLNFIISAPNTGRWHVLFTIRVFTPFFILCYEVYDPWVNLIFGHIQNSKMNKSEANCTLRGGPAIQSQGLFPDNDGGTLDSGGDHSAVGRPPHCGMFCNIPVLPRASLVAQLVKNPPAMQETWVRSLGWEDPLEKGKATHSSILAYRIPWTIQPMGSQRVGHYWATFTDWLFSPRGCSTGAAGLSWGGSDHLGRNPLFAP